MKKAAANLILHWVLREKTAIKTLDSEFIITFVLL